MTAPRVSGGVQPKPFRHVRRPWSPPTLRTRRQGPTTSGLDPLSLTSSSFAQQEDTRAEIWILLTQFETTLQILLRYNVGLKKLVPLEICQCFEKHARPMNN